jgi:hypothetical protein
MDKTPTTFVLDSRTISQLLLSTAETNGKGQQSNYCHLRWLAGYSKPLKMAQSRFPLEFTKIQL